MFKRGNRQNMSLSIAFDFVDLSLSNPVVNTKFAGMYNSFFEGIRTQDCRVTYSQSEPNNKADVVTLPVHPGAEADLEKVICQCHAPIILYVPPVMSWFNRRRLERWSKKILFAYGTDSALVNDQTYTKVNGQHA